MERKQTPHLSPSHPISQGGSHATLIPEEHPSTQPMACLTITWEQERAGDNGQGIAPEAGEGTVSNARVHKDTWTRTGRSSPTAGLGTALARGGDREILGAWERRRVA